jgi:hypothetical protein
MSELSLKSMIIPQLIGAKNETLYQMVRHL